MSTSLQHVLKRKRYRSCRIAIAALALAASTCGHVRATGAAGESPGEQCQTAIAATEHAQRIPPHLLDAIGRIESGRKDPTTGTWIPWPWTINVGGQGAFFPTKQTAIEAVHMLQANGMRSIDVGCLQINLLYHSSAFSNLEQAFDPGFNVAYGARFLKALFGQTGNWATAVGGYHSLTAALADHYRQKVITAWSGAAVEQTTLSPLQALARAWGATLNDAPVAVMRPSWGVPPVTAVATSFSSHSGEGTRCLWPWLQSAGNCRAGPGQLLRQVRLGAR